MNILAITKFPPIQGGESNKAFYLFDELGNRGHDISILTNFDDVSKINISQFNEIDFEFLVKNPNLDIHNIGFELLPNFIPKYDPKTEKLISEGLKIIEKKKIDLIYGWYLLPYVSAAYILSKISSIPFVMQHAGSDLKRVFPLNNLNTYFKEIFKSASGILTYNSSISYFPDKQVKSMLLQSPGFPDLYRPEGKSVDFEKEFGVVCNPNSTFVCLGKFSKAKGFYEIIEAFKAIEDATLLLFCSNKNAIEIELPKNVFIFNSVAPWRVPEILRSVKAMIVPEWNFGVEIHKSRLPIESILCGKTALVSKQIIDNYPNLNQFMIAIETPNIKDTISKIRYLITNDFINDNILKQTLAIRRQIPNFNTYVDKVESFLKERIENLKD